MNLANVRSYPNGFDGASITDFIPQATGEWQPLAAHPRKLRLEPVGIRDRRRRVPLEPRRERHGLLLW